MLMHIETMSHGSNNSFKILASKKKVDNFVLEENHYLFCFFLHVLQDLVMGNGQTCNTDWERVYERYVQQK